MIMKETETGDIAVIVAKLIVKDVVFCWSKEEASK